LIPVIHRLQEPPHWYRQEQLPGALLAPVRSWLLDDGSLTQRLLDTGRDFSLERLAQRWSRPALGEQRLLSMARRERALVRQVALKLDHRPVVYARSVFPVASLTGSLLRLRRLANQSLGSFLFAQAGMRRSPFEVALLPGDSHYLPEALHQERPVWARRSCFLVHNKSLLVSEVFLDGFPGWRAPMPLHRSRRGQVSTAIGRTTQ
jgi:chorismate--pyruvate lyase